MSKNKSGNIFVRLKKEWDNNKGHLVWLISQASGFKRFIVGFLIINIIAMVTSLFGTVMSKYIVDAATGFGTGNFYTYILIMLASSVFSIAFSACTGIFSSYVGEKFTFSVRAKMFDRVQRSIWKDVTKYHSGDMLSRLTSDVGSISNGIITTVPNIIVTIVQAIIIFVLLLKYDPTLCIVALVIGPVGAAATIFYRKRYTTYQRRLRDSESQYYSFFQETLSNFTVVKSFQLEDSNNDHFLDIRKNRIKLVMKSSILSSAMSACMSLVYTTGYVIAFSWCAYRLSVSPDTYSYGTMTLFLSLTGQLQGSIRSLGSIVPQTFSMLVCAKRIREITDIPDEDYTEIDGMPDSVGLNVENVSFTYDSDVILRDVSFSVDPLTHVGIVGSSGAGKTTLIRLLLSMVKPDCGNVDYVLDGNSAESACPASRRFISYVPQGNSLLSGSIRRNLLIANPNATKERIWEVLELVDAAGFIRDLPNGLDTELSEKAGGISEGQAQRISIARAILRDRPVLILDEATSALDEKTEARIFERITGECKKTCFIITHRRSMLKYCDMVVEINDDGSLIVKDK